MFKDIPGCQNVENGQLLHSDASCSGRRSERTAEAAVPSRSVGHPLAVVTLENGLRLILRRNRGSMSAQVEVKDEFLSNYYYETLSDSEVSESAVGAPLSRINPWGVCVTGFTLSNACSVYLCIRIHFQIPFQ
jgi:hypothetical protein